MNKFQTGDVFRLKAETPGCKECVGEYIHPLKYIYYPCVRHTSRNNGRMYNLQEDSLKLVELVEDPFDKWVREVREQNIDKSAKIC